MDLNGGIGKPKLKQPYPVEALSCDAAVPATLMGNQGVRRKGDTRPGKRWGCETLWITDGQKRDISFYAANHDTTV